MSFAPGRRSLLTPRDLPRFPSDGLFDKVGRVVCQSACLPRKELFESWEVARRARRRLRGGRVVDLAAGHGLTALLMLLLDASSTEAIAVDPRLPASAGKLLDAFVDAWPRLAGRVRHVAAPLDQIALASTDRVVSVHACGALSDAVLTRALAVSASVALLPCCHDAETCDDGGLGGWLPVDLAIDATRAARLRAAGYRVSTQQIPSAITPKNRLLLGLAP